MTRLTQILLLAALVIFTGCPMEDETSETMESHQHTNALINETSPYLLQHAHNPVDWMPWGEEALEKAKNENKPLLISIGYSSCHWCHVMEHESFEDTAVAALMNEHFICVKVDREERPDVDQVYMDAVQLMSGRGGWPLNCFALPDGRPFYGGTYFPKEQWMGILTNVNNAFTSEYAKIEEYAARLTQGINDMEALPVQPLPEEFSTDVLQASVKKWKQSFDETHGGMSKAPKFPIPNNLSFLLAYGHQFSDKAVSDHVHLTLEKMAYGGIYDQVGGGFARYSTDKLWKVPHFEKMLYDNAQLIKLYAEAYRHNPRPLYKETVLQTVAFLKREMTAANHAFYSALDADSEGEEGKFYVWKKEELEALAGEDYEFIADYYNVNNKGLWENGNYILLRNESLETVANRHELETQEAQQVADRFKEKALQQRAKRERPVLDDKTLTSWNAMCTEGLAKAAIAFSEPELLEMAKANMKFILTSQRKPDGGLWHSYKGGTSSINGYLDDYAFTVQALIALYEATFEIDYINEAKELVHYTQAHFETSPSGMIYYKSKDDPELVAKKMEVFDNVIPASNSVMATNLFKLGTLLADQSLIKSAKQMLASAEPQFTNYPSGYSQWLLLHQYLSCPFYEIAIVGAEWPSRLSELQQTYLPQAFFLGGETEGKLELLNNKLVKGETYIYVCEHGACQLPVKTTREALDQIKSKR